MEKKKIREMVMKEVDSTVHDLRKNIKRRLDVAIGGPGPETAHSLLQRDPTTAGGALTVKEFDILSKAQFAKKHVKKPKLAEDFVTLNVCPMKRNRKKGYSRSGDYIEIRVLLKSTYAQVAQAAADAVELETLSNNEDSGPEELGPQRPTLLLLRAHGSVVQNKALPADSNSNEEIEWTIGNYLASFPSYRRSRQAIKLGVGCGFMEPSCVESEPQATSKSLACTSESASNINLPVQEDIEVLYAAECGGVGLETDDMKLRFDVFAETRGILIADKDRESAEDFMDHGDCGWQPEAVFYRVARVSRDGELLLCANDDGSFHVFHDTTARFCVVHQSPEEVALKDSSKAVPLYCVAKGHSWDFRYLWTLSGNRIGPETPVIWANKTGLYRCVVHHDVMHEQCSSRVIHVFSPEADATTTVPQTSPVSTQESALGNTSGVLAPQGSILKSTSARELQESTPVTSGIMVYTLPELHHATNNFAPEKLVGEGGFGKVFQGILRGTHTAVKMLSEHGTKMLRAQTAMQLHTEVTALTKFSHPNIVPLMGYCPEPPILIFPFMERGSLFKNLHNSHIDDPLTWCQRMSIMTDTARGLTYLHSANPPLVHHDVNSSNILLDHNREAKICDFGFSIELPERIKGKTLITAAAQLGLPGTLGYQAPEYNEGRYSTWSDVYSYGVVILETYTGLYAFSEDRDDHKLACHCDEELRDKQGFTEIRDQKPGPCPEAAMEMFFTIANACLKNSYKKRLSMSEVLAKWEQYTTTE